MRLIAIGGTVLLALSLAPAAAAAPNPGVVVEDGVSQPVFGYTDAIRERVWVESDFDSEGDGLDDVIAMDIIRPAASDGDLKVPVIMDASPYFTTVCRGNDSECIDDVDDDGINDVWPLFYDNWFVPRGYAVILLHMAGTGFSTGCPTTGGTPDTLSAVTAIDWLNGRRTGVDGQGNEVVADWHNGRTGMIGKSYDGTLANAAASTGVEGLTTIVPISAISSWYDYTRSNGIRFNNNYPSFLSNAVTNPDRRAYCAPFRATLDANDGDETGDYTPFWAERDYNPDIGNVTASVFVAHGINDNNVKPDHFSKWWYGLAEEGVPRKLWVSQEGHVDPFDLRRADWVATIHRWFDYWLQGVGNGIMSEPMVDLERTPGVWTTENRWPVQHAVPTHLWFAPGEAQGVGTLSLTPAGGKPVVDSWTDSSQSENNAVGGPDEAQDDRLIFLSEPLTAPLRFSGTATVELRASVDDVDTNFGAIVVDYGEATRHSTTQDGIRTLSEEDCWGESSATDDACYRITELRTSTNDREVVTKGIVDALNIDDYTTPTELVPGAEYDFSFPLLPEDYVFEEGHRIGIVILASYRSYSSVRDTNGATITLSEKVSRISLPIVGGHQAAVEAGL